MSLPPIAPARPGAAPDQPVRGAERLVALDFVRGVAVLGMLFANITAFSHPFLAYAWPGALPGGGTAADGWIWLVQFVLVDGKFRGLFTLLFGAGLVLLFDHGAPHSRLVRRLVLLLLFGAAHFALLFAGDILVTYALAGFIGLLFLQTGGKELLRTGVLWYIAASLLLLLMQYQPAMLEQLAAARAVEGEAWQAYQAQWAAREARAEAELAVFAQGSYAEVVAFRLTEQAHRVTQAPFLAASETIPLMLVGMGLYRIGLFSGGIDPRRLRRWGWTGLAAGALALLALGAWALARDFPPFATSFLVNGAAPLPNLPMILGLAALLALWAPRAGETWLGGLVVAAGRMAFSNYIATSLVMMMVFQGWAGGLFGELHRAELLAFVVLGWALILAWSRPWLARFRYGPLEWLWRCLTYARQFSIAR